MITIDELTETIRSLDKEKYETVVSFVMDISSQGRAEPNRELMDRTGLSEKRRNFLRSLRKIKIDEAAVNDFRMKSML